MSFLLYKRLKQSEVTCKILQILSGPKILRILRLDKNVALWYNFAAKISIQSVSIVCDFVVIALEWGFT